MKLKKNIAIFTFTWVIINSFSLYAQDDAGVLEVITPLDGTTLTVGNSYTVTVVIRNYGTTTLGNVPVQFSVGLNTQLNEERAGFISPGDTAHFTFSNQLQVTNPGVTVGYSATALFGDVDNTNDRVDLNYPYGAASIASNSSGEIGITVFPNPSGDYISISPNKRQKYSIVLMTIDGKMLRKYNDVAFSGSEAIPLDISWLSNGNYILSFQSDQGVTHKSFIK